MVMVDQFSLVCCSQGILSSFILMGSKHDLSTDLSIDCIWFFFHPCHHCCQLLFAAQLVWWLSGDACLRSCWDIRPSIPMCQNIMEERKVNLVLCINALVTALTCSCSHADTMMWVQKFYEWGRVLISIPFAVVWASWDFQLLCGNMTLKALPI